MSDILACQNVQDNHILQKIESIQVRFHIGIQLARQKRTDSTKKVNINITITFSAKGEDKNIKNSYLITVFVW